MAGTQPLNKLAPFEILDDQGNALIRIDPNGVLIRKIIFSDGTTLDTSPLVNYYNGAEGIDSGTF